MSKSWDHHQIDKHVEMFIADNKIVQEYIIKIKSSKTFEHPQRLKRKLLYYPQLTFQDFLEIKYSHDRNYRWMK